MLAGNGDHVHGFRVARVNFVLQNDVGFGRVLRILIFRNF